MYLSLPATYSSSSNLEQSPKTIAFVIEVALEVYFRGGYFALIILQFVDGSG